jgi:hypothetical protein
MQIPLSYIIFVKEIVYFPLYLYQYFTLKISFKNQIFEAYLYSKIITNFIFSNNINKVVFFGYDYDLKFFATMLFLNKNNINIIQYCNSGFLGKHNLVLVDKLYCRTKIHKNYMKKRKNIFLCNKIEYLFNSKKNKEELNNRLAIYTSGYYARLKLSFSSKNSLLKGIEAEKKMIDSIKEYALINQDIEIVLFIHLHNGIENIDDAKKYYKDFLSLKNVRLQKKDENSIENFYKFNLGLCCMSEIFFDRYERGYKTILINPFTLDDFIRNSTLKNVTLFSQDFNFMEKINFYMQIDNQKYLSLLDNE